MLVINVRTNDQHFYIIPESDDILILQLLLWSLMKKKNTYKYFDVWNAFALKVNYLFWDCLNSVDLLLLTLLRVLRPFLIPIKKLKVLVSRGGFWGPGQHPPNDIGLDIFLNPVHLWLKLNIHSQSLYVTTLIKLGTMQTEFDNFMDTNTCYFFIRLIFCLFCC